MASSSLTPASAQSSASYTYDALGRVTGTTYPSGSSATYTYDGADNRTGLVMNLVGGNHAPVANPDSASVTAGSAITISVRGNDTDADGDTLTVSNVTQGSKGTAAVAGGGASVSYNAFAGQSGTDTFNYTISDGHGGSASAAVTVTISAANQSPTAVNDSRTTAFNTAITFDPRANDSDPNGDALSITSVNAPSSGSRSFTSGSVTYTPNAGFSGTDSFGYSISDGQGGSASATITITVSAPSNAAPVANNDAATTAFNTPITVVPQANDTDADGDTLTVTSLSNVTGGSAVNNSSSVTFTPTSGFSGAAFFDYVISDGHGGTATARVNITVNPAPAMSASASSSAYYRLLSGTVWQTASPTSVNVSVSGGVAPFTYAWEYVSGDTGGVITSATASSVGWTHTLPMTIGTSYVSVWRAKVTDSVGTFAYTGNVNVTLEKENACPNC